MLSSHPIAMGSLIGLSILVLWATLHRAVHSRLAASQRGVERASLEAAALVRRQFLENMSHELRTPLNAIIGFAHVLLKNRGGRLGDQEMDYVSRIADNGARLLELIDDVLNFTQLESGRTEFCLQTLSARDLLIRVAAHMSLLVEAKGISCSVQLVDDAVQLRANEERARHILLHLLSNAVRFTPEGGHITLSCDEGNGWADIRVSNDGRGIPATQMNTIFEPFTQVGRALDQPMAGTGLGLAISRDLARGMGGELLATSSEGVGCTFTLRLPLVTASRPKTA